MWQKMALRRSKLHCMLAHTLAVAINHQELMHPCPAFHYEMDDRQQTNQQN